MKDNSKQQLECKFGPHKVNAMWYQKKCDWISSCNPHYGCTCTIMFLSPLSNAFLQILQLRSQYYIFCLNNTKLIHRVIYFHKV